MNFEVYAVFSDSKYCIDSCRWNVGRRRFLSRCSSSRKERMSKTKTKMQNLFEKTNV